MSTNLSDWQLAADSGQLTALCALLQELEHQLTRERQAVSRLDGAALTDVTSEKQRIADCIQQLVASPQPADNGHRGTSVRTLRTTVGRTLGRVTAQAEANAALLTDANIAVNEVFGARTDSGTYDRHARRVQRARAFFGKAA